MKPGLGALAGRANVRYPTRIGREYEGTDAPKGQLTMHSMVPGDLYREVTVRGVIEGNGTVPARFISRRCSYHHVFQKETK
jgi:hypothetical protein